MLDISQAVVEIDGARLYWNDGENHERRPVPIPWFLADELAPLPARASAGKLVLPSRMSGVLRNKNARREWFNAAATAIEQPGFVPTSYATPPPASPPSQTTLDDIDARSQLREPASCPRSRDQAACSPVAAVQNRALSPNTEHRSHVLAESAIHDMRAYVRLCFLEGPTQ